MAIKYVNVVAKAKKNVEYFILWVVSETNWLCLITKFVRTKFAIAVLHEQVVVFPLVVLKVGFVSVLNMH